MRNALPRRAFRVACFCLLSLKSFGQWAAVPTPPVATRCVSLVGNRIFLGGDGLSVSANGGGNWQSYPLTHEGGIPLTGSDLADLHFFDAQHGVAVGFIAGGSEDLILRTADGGQSWSFAYEGVGDGGFFYSLNDLFFVNANTGWAVGRNGNIYKTTNAGQSWSLQPAGTSGEFYSVWFVNASTGFVAGEDGLYKTTNGGAVWEPTSLGGAEQIAFPTAATGYAAAGNMLSKTTDGGDNWTSVPLPQMDGYINDVYFHDADTGYLLFNNTIVRTLDGGISWEEATILTPFSNGRQFAWLDPQQAVMAGSFLFCWITTNAGAPYRPIAGFDLALQFPCPGASVAATNLTADLPNYTYQWYIDGTPVSTMRNPQLIFPAPNTDYVVRLDVSNGLLTDAVEKLVQTNSLVSLGSPQFQTSQPVCEGNPMNLYATMDYAFWTLTADGQPTGISGNLEQLFYNTTLAETTVFQLQGELVGPCNTASIEAEFTVPVLPLPLSAAVIAETPLLCPGETSRIFVLNSVPGVAYRLHASSPFGNPEETQTGNGDTLFFETPPVQDVLYYFLEVQNQGCQRDLGPAATVTPEWVLAYLYEDQITLAVGQSYAFNDTLNLHGTYFNWTFGPQADPQTASGLNPAFSYTQPGFYEIYLEANGVSDACPNRDTVRVEVFTAGNLPAGTLTGCLETPTPFVANHLDNDEHILDVHVSADGTVYTAGFRPEQWGGAHYNLSLAKFDAAGNLLWSDYQSAFEHPIDVVQRIATTIAADEAGNMYLTGTYYGSQIVVGGQLIYQGTAQPEGFVAKLDPAGNLLWHIRMPNTPGLSAPVGATDLLYVNDQQIYLVAPETPEFIFPDGSRYKIGPEDDCTLLQINADGQLVRARSIMTRAASDIFHSILSNWNPNLSTFIGPATTRLSPRMALNKQGQLVLSGEFRNLIRVGEFLLQPNIVNRRNGFAAIIDLNFNVLNAFSTYGSADIPDDWAAIFHQITGAPSFTVDRQGNIIQSFRIDNPDFSFPHYAEVEDDVVEYGDDSHFLLKYSPAGELLWYRRNGPLETPWLVSNAAGDVHALASYESILALNDADGARRAVLGQGETDVALLTWDSAGAIKGVLPLGSTAQEEETAWLGADGCGMLTALLARDIGPWFPGSDTVRLQLLRLDQDANCAPDCAFELCFQPQDVAFCAGGGAYLYVGAMGEGLNYQWQNNPGGGFVDLSDDAVFSGTQTPLLEIAPAAAPDLAGIPFRCIVTDAGSATLISETAAPVLLDVPLLLSAPPPVAPIAFDQVILLEIEAAGEGLQYEWQYLGPDGWTPVAGLANYFYADSDSMFIRGYDFALQNGQQLRCRVSNAAGCTVYTPVTTLQFTIDTEEEAGSGQAGMRILASPSPFADQVILSVSGLQNSPVTWTIFDGHGRAFWQTTTAADDAKTIFSATGLPAGIYQVRAQTGEKTGWKRVVKMAR